MCKVKKRLSKYLHLWTTFQVLKKYGRDWIVNITDVTDFCKKQHKIFIEEGADSHSFYTASERVYPVMNFDTACRIELDVSVGETTVVSTWIPTKEWKKYPCMLKKVMNGEIVWTTFNGVEYGNSVQFQLNWKYFIFILWYIILW